jgi:hypothetical protein
MFMRASHGILVISFLLVSIGFAPAQSNNPTAIHTVGQALDFWITNTETSVVSAADAMPEEKYSYAPTAGEFAGVRTFAQQIKHLAANNYRMAAYILNQTPTPDQESEAGPGHRSIKGPDHGLPQGVVRSAASGYGYYQ